MHSGVLSASALSVLLGFLPNFALTNFSITECSVFSVSLLNFAASGPSPNLGFAWRQQTPSVVEDQSLPTMETMMGAAILDHAQMAQSQVNLRRI